MSCTSWPKAIRALARALSFMQLPQQGDGVGLLGFGNFFGLFERATNHFGLRNPPARGQPLEAGGCRFIESKGRAVVNLLNLAEDEKIADCRAVRDFDKPDHYLMMATRKGLVKKTELKAYSRPLKSGIIAIKLKEDDELIDVAITKTGDEIVLATAGGMAIRFGSFCR